MPRPSDSRTIVPPLLADSEPNPIWPARDPLTFAGAALMLLVVSALACDLPARRATRVDPLVVLRAE